MGVQILNKDVSLISSIANVAKAQISNVGGIVGWASDVIPNALNWTNVTGVYNGTSNTQTISGINTSITLRIESNYNGTGGFDMYVNDVQYNLTDGILNGFYNHVVNNGDTIYFYRNSPGGPVGESVTVKNASDNNTILDTFTIDLAGDI